MSLPISPEMAAAMLQQERLQQISLIHAATEKVKTIDAQLGAIEMTLQIQARAAEAQAVAEDQPAQDPAPEPAQAPSEQ